MTNPATWLRDRLTIEQRDWLRASLPASPRLDAIVRSLVPESEAVAVRTVEAAIDDLRAGFLPEARLRLQALAQGRGAECRQARLLLAALDWRLGDPRASLQHLESLLTELDRRSHTASIHRLRARAVAIADHVGAEDVARRWRQRVQVKALPDAWHPAWRARLAEPDHTAQPRSLLAELDRVSQRIGVAPVSGADLPLHLPSDGPGGTVTAALPDREETGLGVAGPRVSVVVYAVGAPTGSTVRNLEQQTYPHLEILLIVGENDSVDDGLPPRVTVVRVSTDVPRYAAQNHALRHAGGELVTCQTPMEWSHPGRIEQQVQAVMSGGQGAATVSALDIDDHGRPAPGPFDPYPALRADPATLLLRRSLLDSLGGWQPIHRLGDEELARRLGTDDLRRLDPGLTLALRTVPPRARDLRDVDPLYRGPHATYRRRCAQTVPMSPPDSVEQDRHPRWAAIPWTIRTPRPLDVDVIVAACWRLRGGTTVSAWNMARAALHCGLRPALFNYPLTGSDLDVPDHLVAQADDLDIPIVNPGEGERARHLILTYPKLLQRRLDRLPAGPETNALMVVNQMAARDYAGHERAYELNTVVNNAAAAGVERWAPISPLVRRLMCEVGGYPPPTEQTWYPLIAERPRTHRPAQPRRPPVLGRHGRDHPLKWPRSSNDRLAAFCADHACEVRFLGGTVYLEAGLPRWPRNWRAAGWTTEGVHSFLDGLDFLVHQPADDYIEEFGRVTIEAMVQGVPVVLPWRFREVFGDAALYAHTSEVWSVVQEAWTSPVAYAAVREAGYDFIDRNCKYDVFAHRLQHL